jgi:hypothetical protein
VGAYDYHVVWIVEHLSLRLGCDDDGSAPYLVPASREYNRVAEWELTVALGRVLMTTGDQEALAVLLVGVDVASLSLAEKRVGRVVVLELRLGHE